MVIVLNFLRSMSCPSLSDIYIGQRLRGCKGWTVKKQRTATFSPTGAPATGARPGAAGSARGSPPGTARPGASSAGATSPARRTPGSAPVRIGSSSASGACTGGKPKPPSGRRGWARSRACAPIAARFQVGRRSRYTRDPGRGAHESGRSARPIASEDGPSIARSDGPCFSALRSPSRSDRRR